MKTNALVFSAVLLLVLASAGMGWRASRAASAADVEYAALIGARTAQDADRRRLEEQLATAGVRRGELQAALTRARAPEKPPLPIVAAPGGVAGKNAATAPAMPSPQELMAHDPKLQALYLESRRAAFATTYGPFLVTRALTAEQTAKLTDARMKFHAQELDLQGVMLDQKLLAADPAVAELRQRADDDLRMAYIAVLGQAGYEDLRRYESTLPAREMVERFAGAAALGDVPLNAQQAEQLTQVMAAAAGDLRPGRSIDPSRIDWAAVDAQAKGVLSPAQLALFQRIEPVGGGPSRWMAQLNRAMQQAQARSATSAGSAPPK
jgi:hypothetical protein